MSTELCFYYSSGEGKHSSAAPHMQLEIFWLTPHTAWSSSLLDIFSISILSLLQYTLPSLSIPTDCYTQALRAGYWFP